MLGGRGGVEHLKHAHVGVFWVFDVFVVKGVEENVEHVEHAPKGVLDVLEVFDIRVGKEHIEHAPKGVFDVLNVRGEVRIRPNTSNAPKMACSTCLT